MDLPNLNVGITNDTITDLALFRMLSLNHLQNTAGITDDRSTVDLPNLNVGITDDNNADLASFRVLSLNHLQDTALK